MVSDTFVKDAVSEGELNYHLVKPESRYTLPWLVAKFLRGPLLWAMVPRICLIGFEFAQPFLITRVISFVDQPADLETNNLSYGLIAVAAIIYLGIAVSNVLVFLDPMIVLT